MSSLYKKIRPSNNLIKIYGPISFTPTLSKIAEEYVVQEHVKPAVLKHIRPDQYDCVPFSSTKHASEVRVNLMDYKKPSF